MSEINLFMQISESIATDILNGKYAKGDKLPSLAQLCERYQVGRNTIRAAMQDLEKNGFIENVRGRKACVIFDVDEMISRQLYQKTLLGRKQTMNDIFMSLGWFLPEVIIAMKKKAGEDSTALIEKIMDVKWEEYAYEQEETLVDYINQICRNAVAVLDNSLLDALFQKMLRFIYIPISKEALEGERYSRAARLAHDMLPKMASFLLRSNEVMLRKSLSFFCNYYRKTTNQYIDRLCAGVDDASSIDMVSFHWNSLQNMDYLYIHTALKIVRDINDGVYQETLPSLKEIADAYQVSLKTVRNATNKLEDFHIIQKTNGLKSKITMFEKKNLHVLLANEEVVSILMMYKEALQALALLVKGVNKPILSSIEKEEVNAFLVTLEGESHVFLNYMTFIFSYSNQTLYMIYEELRKYLVWNIYSEELFKEGEEKYGIRKRGHEFVEAIKKRDYKMMNQYIDLVYTVLEVDFPLLIAQRKV